MPRPDREEGEVALHQAVCVPVEFQEQLAGEDVERLLERVEVTLEPAAGLDHGDGQLGVDSALGTTDEDPARDAMRIRRGGCRAVGEGPVDRCDLRRHLIPAALNTDAIVAGPSSAWCG